MSACIRVVAVSGTACKCVSPSGSGALLPAAPSPGVSPGVGLSGHSFTLTGLEKSSKDSVSGRSPAQWIFLFLEL